MESFFSPRSCSKDRDLGFREDGRANQSFSRARLAELRGTVAASLAPGAALSGGETTFLGAHPIILEGVRLVLVREGSIDEWPARR